jgi:phosphatidylserine/phosphatidylglycerophosphate/cardiolipin synthase-like enzyme
MRSAPVPYKHFLAFGLLFCALVQLACLESGTLIGAPTSTPQNTLASDWITIYFTDPTITTAESLRGGPDTALAAAIRDARMSVDIAIYDLNLWSVRDALVAAHRSGVTVRMVTESDNLDEAEIQELKEAGIPVLGDRREGLMHHKFVVVDRLEVWMGSMNFTTTDGYLNDNHLVRIRSSRLAEDYTVEFEEMFTKDRFGPEGLADTPYPTITIGGAHIEVYISPDDGVLERLVELISNAKTSVNFMAYSFTSDELAQAMIARAIAGVKVAGVFEEAQTVSNIGSEYETLIAAGLPVRLDGNQRNMHHKVLIIDESIVVIGSYNFSSSAETKNDENVLVIQNPEIAARFMEEFVRVYAAGR